MTEPQNAADLFARIKPTMREEGTTLCLRPDLLAAHEEATEALAEQRADDAAANQRLGQGISRKAKDLAKRVQEIEDEIEATQVRFVLRAMSNAKWRSLCDSHPPRKGNDLDAYAGYDRDAVLDAAVRLCIVDPVFDEDTWRQFLDMCNPSEWAELRGVVQSVNRAVVDAPKSVLASQTLARPARGSKQPAAGV